MKLGFILLFLLGLMSGQIFAQEMPKAEDVVERCITAPTEPVADWTFAGTIITYQSGDGIHGFRADNPSRYYIAFDNDVEYGRFGTLSPDGQWFAVYRGGMNRTDSMLFNNYYFVTDVELISTLPSRETYSIPFTASYYSLSAYFNPPDWLDNSQLAVYKSSSWGVNEGWYLIDPFQGTSQEISDDQLEQMDETATPWYEAIRDHIYPQPLFSSIEEAVADGMPQAFLLRLEDWPRGRLHIADAKTGQIYNTCIETSYAFAVSPAGDQVAVGIGEKDGFVYVVDLGDWAAYRLDLAANHVVAWVADP